jgi:hypothetical protein
MRARRPELFSDSKVIEKPHISREVLEYHLETLTSRKQEYEFEYFARRIAEREVCPNLIPQTGPTGGGDSKTDTETYPVADTIALTWYEGIGRKASRERWAFAFSAVKKWRDKARSDIKNIVQTKRGYKKAFFISNQFIKDKDRAQIQDELQNTHKIQVTILDRTWLLKCVFEHGREQMAIETLGLTTDVNSKRHFLGPRDTQKESELEELERQIEDCARYTGVEYQLAEDCMRAALLARNLERPRTEVDGRFDMAERIAEKVGYRQQRMRIAYIRSWTSFWWYDDIHELNQGYDRVQKFAVGSEQSEDIAKLVNLWLLLAATVWLGQLDSSQSKLDTRKETLKDELDRLAADKLRPNNALLARTHKLLLRLYESLSSETQINHILEELTQIVDGNQDNIEYPADFLLQIIQELGELIPHNSTLDKLIESVIDLTGRREGKATAGCLFIDRGYQKLEKGMKYDAIRLFGRAQENLTMNEYLKEFCASLIGCALAYESAGLLWAARRNVLTVVNQSLREFWKHGEYVPGTLTSIQKLVWLELQLGRVPYILSWMDTALFVASKLSLKGPKQEQFKQDRLIQDVVLGLLLLKTELWELKWLDFVPGVLDAVGLTHSWMALLFALGYEDYLREEKVIPANQNSEEVLDFFVEWLNQPAANDLPDNPDLIRESEVTLNSYVIGCHIKVKAANDFESICLGETILAVFEAFLATGLNKNIMPFQPELRIRIKPSEFVTGIPQYRLAETEGVVRIEIRHTPNMVRGAIDQRSDYIEWLREIMIFIMSQIAVIHDPEKTFERMATEGAAFTRALSIVDTDVCIKNILGENPRFCLSDWKSQTKERIFPLQRSVSWSEGRVSTAEQTDSDLHPPKLKEYNGLDLLSGIDNLKHRDIRIHSVINIPLWDRAKWNAIAYAWSPNELPFLVLGFTNSDAGKAIFKGWQARFGKVDEQEYIRVSVVMGTDERLPYRYSVVIGVNPEFLRARTGGSHSFMVSKVLGMDPSTPKNMEQFLTQYKETNSYIILPGHYENPSLPPVLCPELGIEKRNLRVCEAWQIDEHDPDICALQTGINPIIPDDIKNAPVHRALKHITKLTKQRR